MSLAFMLARAATLAASLTEQHGQPVRLSIRPNGLVVSFYASGSSPTIVNEYLLQWDMLTFLSGDPICDLMNAYFQQGSRVSRLAA